MARIVISISFGKLPSKPFGAFFDHVTGTAGGEPLVLKFLFEAGHLHESSCSFCDGRIFAAAQTRPVSSSCGVEHLLHLMLRLHLHPVAVAVTPLHDGMDQLLLGAGLLLRSRGASMECSSGYILKIDVVEKAGTASQKSAVVAVGRARPASLPAQDGAHGQPVQDVVTAPCCASFKKRDELHFFRDCCLDSCPPSDLP